MALGRGAKRDKNGPLVIRVEQKLCRRCSEVKTSDLFFHSKLSLDGLCTYCKACQKELNKQARAKRPDVLRPQVGCRCAAVQWDDTQQALCLCQWVRPCR